MCQVDLLAEWGLEWLSVFSGVTFLSGFLVPCHFTRELVDGMHFLDTDPRLFRSSSVRVTSGRSGERAGHDVHAGLLLRRQRHGHGE